MSTREQAREAFIAKRPRSDADSGIPPPKAHASAGEVSRAASAREALDAANGVPTAAEAPLPNRLGTFVEYDLSTLQNSRGGFLVDSEETDPRAIREKEILQANKEQRLAHMARGNLAHAESTVCSHCGSPFLEDSYRAAFNVYVCAECKRKFPETYALLNKTEVKQDYLLTDSELADESILPHMLRPNPHRSTYSNMMLYMRGQVEAYAFSPARWGSPEALDAEFERREADKKARRNTAFEKKLRDLRRNTRTTAWHAQEAKRHKHTFVQDGPRKKCTTCDCVIEAETL